MIEYQLFVRLKSDKLSQVHLDDELFVDIKGDNVAVFTKAVDEFRSYDFDSSREFKLLVSGTSVIDTNFEGAFGRESTMYERLLNEHARLFVRSMVHLLVEDVSRHGLDEIFELLEDKSSAVMLDVQSFIPTKDTPLTLTGLKDHLSSNLIKILPISLLAADIIRGGISVMDAVSYSLASDVERSFMRKSCMLEFQSVIKVGGGGQVFKNFRVMDYATDSFLSLSRLINN